MTAPTQTKPFDALLEFLKHNRGFDFTGYKRSTLERRITKRTEEVGIGGHHDYIEYLELHPEEFAVLFNTILINVTAFFRDDETWQYLREEVLPQMLKDRKDESVFRVWCAGCASGEETYTTAMMLAEVMGEDRFRERVKIYATDVDDEALDQARAAAYVAKQLEPVPPELVERYFDRSDHRYHFRKDLRRNIIFGRNDLVQDAPISRVDLLVCRNTLMYFNAEAQSQILSRLYFALQPEGVLMLGKSEMLLTHGDLFTPVDLKRRVFRKVAKTDPREGLRVLGEAGARPAPGGDALREEAYHRAPGAQVVLDAEGLLAGANADARGLFGLSVRDIGQPIQDLQLSYRPVELRSHLDHVAESRHPIRVGDVPWGAHQGEDRIFDVRLTPLIGPREEYLGTTIAFVDVTEAHRLKSEVERSRRELEQAYEELQSTVEELETTNEELQSTNEELETTNEELQSSNEELETMNEELQSTNEELETMN